MFEKLLVKTKTDGNIKVMMEYALAAGNYMNGQSARGGAYGFKFDMMEKLADVKTTDNKSNLLMYLIQKAEDDLKREVVQADENLDDIEQAGIYLINLSQNSFNPVNSRFEWNQEKPKICWKSN